jgi:hypothetical protein
VSGGESVNLVSLPPGVADHHKRLAARPYLAPCADGFIPDTVQVKFENIAATARRYAASKRIPPASKAASLIASRTT